MHLGAKACQCEGHLKKRQQCLAVFQMPNLEAGSEIAHRIARSCRPPIDLHSSDKARQDGGQQSAHGLLMLWE